MCWCNVILGLEGKIVEEWGFFLPPPLQRLKVTDVGDVEWQDRGGVGEAKKLSNGGEKEER